MSAAKQYRIRGRVQGVWFRESTRQQALRLGISGHAVNLVDGSVEVVAWGDPVSLDHLESWLHEGPRLARVTSLTVSDLDGEAPESFTTG